MMAAFTITLIDRLADYGIVGSVLVWAALNVPSILRRAHEDAEKPSSGARFLWRLAAIVRCYNRRGPQTD